MKMNIPNHLPTFFQRALAIVLAALAAASAFSSFAQTAAPAAAPATSATPGQAPTLPYVQDTKPAVVIKPPAPGATPPAPAPVTGPATFQSLRDAPKTSPQVAEKEGAMHKKARERAEARWDAIAKAQYLELHKFLTPASQRRITPEVYAQRMQQSGLKAANIESVTCKEEECEVILRANVEITLPRIGKQTTFTLLPERWALFDGQMYLLGGV